MSKDTAISLGMHWNPDICINMQSAQGHVERKLGLTQDISFIFGAVIMLLQIHVLNKPLYKILLGRPFDVLTRSNIQNERDGSQTITLTDPGSDITVVLPTYPRGQPPKSTVEESAEAFQFSMI
ncbi:hypothetical protein M413DRAFT_79858 [Hebeloma cylindrosporum]|uniref:Uncharacterized protein n=1 Tax=Hebeloma cylindrosporum TaxID=76867 RepID=A0A0C2XAD0_HEBCY|nr:hypothetical protein M413DRAFT_79858 [Hebeloma cylindrosporum h7]